MKKKFFLSSLYSPRWARHANRLKTLLNLWIWIYFLLVRSSFKWECVFSFVWVFVYILASPLPAFHPATYTFTYHIKFIHIPLDLIGSIKYSSENQGVTFVSKQRMSICFHAHPSGSSKKLLLTEEAWCFIQLHPNKNISGYQAKHVFFFSSIVHH